MARINEKLELIEKMNYVDLLSYIEETNRCPGGKRTISEIVNYTHISKKSNILEIGSNTGFTSIELAKILDDPTIIGIDVNANAVKKSQELLSGESAEVQRKVSFEIGDASDLRFSDSYFDLIVTGGANGFIAEKSRKIAVSEYRRVLKTNGFLAATQLFYHKPVPQKILTDLEKVLGFPIRPLRRAYWLKLFLNSGFELYNFKEKKMRKRSLQTLNEYVDYIIESSEPLKGEDDLVKNAVRKRWYEIMDIFNNNHEYLSFMIVILRNTDNAEQREFFFEDDFMDPYTICKEEEEWDV